MTSTVEAVDKAPPSAEEELAAQTEITLQPEEKDEEKVLSLEQHALENETTTTEETLEKVMFSTVEEQEDKEDEDKDVPQRKQNEEIPPAEQKSEKEKQAEVLNLNNEVVKMRKEVNRVRALIIRKLTRQISALKKKKGKDQEVQKNQRRASRLLEEIHEMKALKPDMVTKIALQRVISFDLVCKNPESTITDRAIARIVSHPQFSKKILAIKIAIEAFKDKMKGRGTKENKGKAGTQAEKGTPKFRDGKNIKDKADSVVEQTERTEGEEEDGETIDKPEEDQEKSTPTAEMTSTQNLQTPHKLTSKDRFKNAVHTKASGKSSNIKPARKDIPKAAVPKAAIKEGGSGWVGNKPEVTKKSPKPEPTPEVTPRMKDEKESATESSDEEEQSSDEEEEPLDNGAEGGFSRSDKDTKNKNMAAPKYTVVEEHVKDTPQSKVIDKRSKLKPAPEVHQGMEDESEMESSDEEEVLDDSSEECDPEESVSRSVCAAFSKATGAKDLNKNKPQSKAAGKTTGAESHQKVKDDTESDLESSDEEEEEKEYFDDSTEERFRKRSSQSESESDDDFFVGKVSKFKKKSGETRNVKSELKSNPSEPPQTLEHKPGQSQLDELASRLNSRGSSKLESLFCPSLSASNTRGGGQSWGGRGRGRGSGRDRFSSGPPKFQPRGRGGGAGFNANQYESNFRGRGGWRGRGDAARQPDRREAGFLSQEPPKQALHPSWEASKKRKEQQGQIQAFQGKKIKFDDD